MPAASLDVRRLSAGHGQTRIIDDMSFAVPAGGRLAILGRNGVGKTTLLQTLVGQARLYSGSIALGARDITALSSPGRAMAGLGYVPQARNVFHSLTVEENLFVGLKHRPRSAIAEAYELFPRLAARRRHLGSQLSGGEQQMLSTARAILGKPSVLLLDEPLEGLAPVVCDELLSALTRLAATGESTILLVEQRITLALSFATTALILTRGRIAWTGPTSGLAATPEIVESLLGVSPR